MEKDTYHSPQGQLLTVFLGKRGMFPLTKASSTIVTSDPVSQLPEPLQIQRFLGNCKFQKPQTHPTAAYSLPWASIARPWV